jgi:hypothetical protein
VSITNYAELQTAINNWSDRKDLADRNPEFISLAEAKFNRNLRLMEMEAIVTGTLSAASTTIAFPSDCLQITKLQINGSVKYTIEQTTKNLLITDYPDPGSGTPAEYAINGNQIEIRPPADSDYTYELSYYQKIPDLATNSTNWLLTLYPDAYLYGCLLEVAPYLKNPEETAVWSAQYNKVMIQMIKTDKTSRFGAGPIRMRVR